MGCATVLGLKLQNYSNIIEKQKLLQEKTGKKVFIPRITLNTGESSSLPFILYRKQFPITLTFCMSINKSQRQSFDYVGLYIKRPLFSHGQLYVALSRYRNPKNIYIQNELENSSEIETIVWKEVLDDCESNLSFYLSFIMSVD